MEITICIYADTHRPLVVASEAGTPVTTEGAWWAVDERVAARVVTKPYAERRILATARRRWPDKQVRVTSEQVGFEDYLAGGIPIGRILSMLAGEAIRLEAYAATGLIDSSEPVPGVMLNAAHALQATGFDSRAV